VVGGLINFDFDQIVERCEPAEAIGEFLNLWANSIDDAAQRDALLTLIKEATSVKLGDALVKLVGTNPVLDNHKDALNDLPWAMRDGIVSAGYDAAQQGMQLVVDFGQIPSGYVSQVTTVFDGETGQMGRKIEVFVPRHT
jgi:hypothetical protein